MRPEIRMKLLIGHLDEAAKILGGIQPSCLFDNTRHHDIVQQLNLAKLDAAELAANPNGSCAMKDTSAYPSVGIWECSECGDAHMSPVKHGPRGKYCRECGRRIDKVIFNERK